LEQFGNSFGAIWQFLRSNLAIPLEQWASPLEQFGNSFGAIPCNKQGQVGNLK
jgi:hypothetical protein